MSTREKAAPDLPRRPCLLPSVDFSLSGTPHSLDVSVASISYGTIECDVDGVEIFRWLEPLLDGSHTTTQILRLGRERGHSRDDVTLVLQCLSAAGVLHDLSTAATCTRAGAGSQ